MSNNQGRIEWEYLETQEGQLKPGFQVSDSDVADFSIISNSAGGATAKEYSIQLQLILEGLTASEMVLVRVEVDSSKTSGLALEQRVLGIHFPIVMAQVDDHLGLRKRIEQSQKPIGQSSDVAETGKGNGNRRIRMHISSNGVSSSQLLNGLIPLGGEFRLGTSVSATDVINQIHTLTKQEVQAAIDEWSKDGRETFFARHKVHSAFKYKIAVDDAEFDAKAIVVGALRNTRPKLGDFKTAIFNGNALTIAQPLRKLGFDVLDLELDEIEVEDDRHERELLNRGLIGPVERHQIVKSRRGQGVFRDNVESREPKCRITGVSNPRYLRASHIKPWRKSSDIEKIDGNNGLMLAPHVDFLFDRGFISFEDDGTLIVSVQIEDGALESWGIPSEVNVGKFSPEQAVYLKFHRENELKD
jgi:hypothetical protein